MNRKTGTTRPVVYAAIFLLALLPILYVLSSGPVAGMYFRGYVSEELTDAYRAPLCWAGERCRPLEDFIFWYDSLFVPAHWRNLTNQLAPPPVALPNSQPPAPNQPKP